MNIVLIVLLNLVMFSIGSALMLAIFSLPTIVRGYRQRRQDEFYMAERLTAEVKATRHRDVR